MIAVPAIGGLVIGLMARYGSEKIRGHGIPEAIEAILFNKSRMSPKVAMLKPISSGIAIGSGGPFGAEGPIIMTGGALGSLIGQFFHITAARAQDAAGGRRRRRHDGGVRHADRGGDAGRRAAAVRIAPAQPAAGGRRLLRGGGGAARCCWTAARCSRCRPPRPTCATLGSCVIAGLAAGALSWTVSTALYKVEDLFGRLPIHWMWWPALGGLVVGIGGWLEPRALGVGYDVIGDLLRQPPCASTSCSR